MKSISIVINARVNSSRVERKLIRPFAGTTLLDIVLSKFCCVTNFPVYLAACEKEILDIYKKYSDKIFLLKRSEKSVKKGLNKHSITFEHYRDIPTKYIMSVNACCPF